MSFSRRTHRAFLCRIALVGVEVKVLHVTVSMRHVALATPLPGHSRGTYCLGSCLFVSCVALRGGISILAICKCMHHAPDRLPATGLLPSKLLTLLYAAFDILRLPRVGVFSNKT